MSPQTGFSGDTARPLIQVVDDDPLACRLLQMGGAAMGVDVVVADSIAAARAQLSSHPIDVTVMDGWLPDGNGLDLVAWMRGSHHLTRLPIVFCTADPARAASSEALGLSIEAVILKPIHVPTIQEHLGHALRKAPRRWEADDVVADRLGLSSKEHQALVVLIHKELTSLLHEMEACVEDEGSTDDIKTLYFRAKSAALTVGAIRLVETIDSVPADDLRRTDLRVIADALRADTDTTYGRFAQRGERETKMVG